MLPNCHLGSGSGQGLLRFLGGCPPIGCDRIAWAVKCKPASSQRRFNNYFSFVFFFSPLLPASSFDFWCRYVCCHRFQMVNWCGVTRLIFRGLKTVWERRLDPFFVPRKVLLPERCQLKSIVSGALWLSAVEAIFWNQGSFLASSPTSRFDSAWL